MESAVTKYVNALVSIARDEKKLLEYKEAVKSFDALLRQNNELKTFLSSYFVKNTNKFRLIDEICSDLKLDYFANYLKFLTKKHIIYHFHQIAKEIILALNDELGIADGFVYSVKPLEKEQLQRITKAISKKLGVEVELENILDERLIGGVKVIVHDHVFDGSIQYKLDSMKQNLKERRAS